MIKKEFLKPEKMNENIKRIAVLREEAASLLIENNAIVEQIWELEEKLSDPSQQSDTKLLEKQISDLNHHLEEKNYSQKIDELKQKIYELEIKEYGTSDMLSNSPSSNNRLI